MAPCKILGSLATIGVPPGSANNARMPLLVDSVVDKRNSPQIIQLVLNCAWLEHPLLSCFRQRDEAGKREGGHENKHHCRDNASMMLRVLLECGERS